MILAAGWGRIQEDAGHYLIKIKSLFWLFEKIWIDQKRSKIQFLNKKYKLKKLIFKIFKIFKFSWKNMRCKKSFHLFMHF